MAKRQTKASKPRVIGEGEDRETIAVRRAERREMESRGITVNADPRTEEILGAWRADCFNLLLRGRPAETGAVQWLEELIRTAQGENGGERRPDFIRGSCEGAPGQNVSQAMIEADRTLCAVESSLPPATVRMLFDLLKPDAALLTRWRDVVRRATGETDKQAQGAAVRAACTALVWVRDNIGRLRRETRIAA